ncbi:hypothetical protein KFK09_023357 [Dendrobium nobile]|uniref:Cation-transporting P-type ATPase C-terminal domain-containing protein n=1 Tax=Dendrobium nobile TaxID=94219 RepID=A0A8T3AKV2_DENNO|nr:hypothetical protein KFK09_023357 [Dendrobium nobile]
MFYDGTVVIFDQRKPLITNIMWRNLIVQHFTYTRIFNEFNARKPDEMNVFTGVTKNHLFMGIIGITLVLQIVIIEFLGKFSKTVRLSELWMVSIGIAFLSWPLAVAGSSFLYQIFLWGVFSEVPQAQRKESQDRKREKVPLTCSLFAELDLLEVKHK